MTPLKKSQETAKPGPDHSAEEREPPTQPTQDSDISAEGAEAQPTTLVPCTSQTSNVPATRQTSNDTTAKEAAADKLKAFKKVARTHTRHIRKEEIPF